MPFETSQLQERYSKDADFRQRVDKSEQDYQTLLAKVPSKQACIAEHITENILQKFTQQSSHSIYFFYGFLQPPPGSHTLQLTLFFLKNFKPERKEKFIFVYFNNETPSSDYYFQFKYILTLLPLRLVQNLQDFILVKPYFYIKAHDYVGLGSINKIFSQRYHTLENCAQLCKSLKISVHDFVSFVPEDISMEFPKNLKRRPSLINYRFNLQGQNLTESQRKEKSQFQLAINSLVKKEIYKLENYELGEFGIPIIIQLLIHYFRTKPEGLKEEGIFRKSVSIDEENETLEELSSRNYEYLEHIKNPYLIACLIKRFFTNLKEPIIPYATYEAILHDQGIANKKQHVKKQIQSLPKLNFLTIAFLIEFLLKDVTPNEKYSKMSANNLAICFSPSLMRSEKISMADIINASKAVSIMNIMLANFEQIFGSDQQRNQAYRKNAITKKKDFTNAIKKELDIYEEEKMHNFSGHQSRHSSIIIDIPEHVETPTFGSPQNEQLYSAQTNNQFYVPQTELKEVPVGSKAEEKYLISVGGYEIRSKSGSKMQQMGGMQGVQESKPPKLGGYFGEQKSEGSQGGVAEESTRKSRINFNYHPGKVNCDK